MPTSKNSRAALAEVIVQRLRDGADLDSASAEELRKEWAGLDVAALVGHLATIDADVGQLMTLLSDHQAMAAISATRRRLADGLVACVETGDAFPNEVRHAFGVIGPYHDAALRSAVIEGMFGREEAVRAAFDGAALRRFLSGLRVEVGLCFDSTIGIGSRQSISDECFVRFEAPFEVRTALGSFQLLVSNSVELWRAAATAQFEPETTSWLDRTISKNSVMYDIGANIGYFSLYAWSLGAANVFAFEPEPLNFSRLNENLYLNGASSVLALPFALSDRSMITRFGYRDFVKGASSPHGVSPPAGVHHVGCVCERLDSLLHDGTLCRPTHIKLDVDGHERHVLAGSELTLREPQLAHLMVEMQLENATHLVAELARAGFRNTAAHARGGKVANYLFERW